MLTVFLYLVVFPFFAFTQFLSYDAIRMRVPGRCMSGDYDCGLGQCVPISQFRDGKPDCMDGSDEWCFIGQVSCGPVYCADYKDALPCIVYPKCDGSSKQLPWCLASKEKLCADKTSFPCKGYGECVLWEWLMDGKKDCMDGSDEDENYVMPLEHAYRCARNQTGLFLPKPIPPPPEDHPSLYVEGCSMCPNTLKSSTASSEIATEHTTPKYPFISSSSFGNTQAPLSNFPLFPSEETKTGEFFPPGVEISRVTHSQRPDSPILPNEPIGDFFPTHSTTISPISPTSTQSHTFRLITIPSISQTNLPHAPLIFPMRPDLPPITTPNPLNNWPIPTVTNINEPHHQTQFPPITYPGIVEENIPPIRPGIIISRPITSEKPKLPSEYESGGLPSGNNPFEAIATAPSIPYQEIFTTSASFSIYVRPTGLGNEFEENVHNQKPGVDTLIPLVPPNALPSFPTRKPLTIPSYFTQLTKQPSFPSGQHVTNKPHIIDHVGLPTLIPDSEIEKYVQTEVSPSWITEAPSVNFVTQRKTTISEGFIEERPHSPPPDNNQTPQTENGRPLPETTTLRHTKTTARSKIIHVGPNGVVEKIDNNHGVETDTKSDVKPTSGTDNVIHIGGPSGLITTESTESTDSFESTSTEASSSVPTSVGISSTTEAGTTHSVGDAAIDECVRKLSGDTERTVVCNCPNGQFKNEATGNCEDDLSLVTVKLHVNSICDTDKASVENKQRVLHQKIGNLYTSCIRSQLHGSALVATIRCDDCTSQDINRVISRKSFGDPGNLNVTVEALGSELCSDPDYNHCHVYSDCVMDKDGLRYACKCRKGTTDISNGYGRQCDGFPEESDCIMVLGICLIVWLMFLLGAFMLSLLGCIACYALCRYRCCCRNIAIHPETSDGLQTVVIGSKAAKTVDLNRERLPHMKAIFAESLRHSAKGSTSVASAFALADFRRKKVSKPPEMSKVPEETPENPPVPISNSYSLPKVSSFARISSNTANSEPPTPVGVIETPILEKNSSSVSLVSANDNAPQLPSLPLPLPVPISTSASTNNLEEKEAVHAQEKQVAETERPASSHSIGVQPTIWETYRVLGQQYSKSDLTERKPSVDSLEQMFEARLAAETSRTTKTIPTVRTEKSEGSAIMFTAKPQKDNAEKLAPEQVIDIDEKEVFVKTADEIKNEAEEVKKNVEEAKETTLKETDSKLANMIGVTSFHTPQPVSRPDSGDKKEDQVEPEKETGTISPSLEKSLEAALLIEMAKRGIELPLSPKTPVPTAGELDKMLSQQTEIEDSDVIPVKHPIEAEIQKKDESRKSSAKSIASSRKSKIPSASQSRVASASASAKQNVSQIDEKDNEPDVFVPQGAKTILVNKKKLLQRGGASDLVFSTDESDPEVAFFKRLEKMRLETDRFAPVHMGRKYSRRRKPERTLSSISEKSAEIAAEEALDYPVDTSISCPPTTRAFLEPRAHLVPRYVFKRKVIEATDETSDVDIPKLSPAKHQQPIVSSPEIPDVTFQRSMENLHKSEFYSKSESLVGPSSSRKKSSAFLKKNKSKNGVDGPSSVHSSRRSSKLGSKATTPRNGDDTPASHTSRSTRHSVISRKIAIRRQELKAVSGSAHDLSDSRSNRSSTHHLRGAKSVGDLLRRRPNWDISPYRESPGPTSFLPPITPTRGVRTSANSPQPRQRRSDSHFSMTSLPAISHSPTSFWSSPHFNPSQDSRKPPKEDLWWNPNKRQ